MRLVIARCTVDYVGRLTAHLPSALRLVLVKADGSVSIHADDRAYKPLNWMSPPCTLRVAEGADVSTWTVTNKADEKLGDGWRLVRREYPTAIGPVDILARDAGGATVAVEIKRRGEIDGVEQLTRYLELLNRDPLLTPVRGVFAAQEIKPQARVLAVDRGIDCVVLDYDALRGFDDPHTRLF